jgi:NAD/NADP transhydrogenase beta subunit
MMQKILKLSILIIAMFVMSQTPAYAYLDPGTGSLIMQMLAAIIIGAIAFWRSIVVFFKNIINNSANDVKK